jgi:NADH dehydrogenase FAD-containing subunit
MQYLQFTPDEEFDLIVVGSGNGACGFLSECLKHVPLDYNVLVLEEGHNFFFTSDIIHIRMGGVKAIQMEMHLHFIML